MQFFRLQEHGRGQAVHGRIAPALVIKPTCPVERAEEATIRVRTEEVEVGNLEIAPEVAQRPWVSPIGARVKEGGERHEEPAKGERRRGWLDERAPHGALCDTILRHVLRCGAKQRGRRRTDFPQGHDVAVALPRDAHVAEGIVGYVAGILHFGLEAPVPFVGREGGVVEEEARIETTHVVIVFVGGVREPARGHLLHGLLCLLPVHDVLAGGRIRRPRPHLAGHLLEDGIPGCLPLQRVDELRREGLVVEKDIRVVEPAVELGLETADGVDGAFEV